MDYLDPRKRRAYHIRLIVGYILVAIVIGLGTVIIVYGANGYGINTKTGQIVQNALLFADSHPGGAEIFLNGRDRHVTTAARLVLPTGKYTLTLKKDGYRDWTREFQLDEQSVARYVYPFLFPLNPSVKNLKTYPSAKMLITQSPDRRWLLIQNDPGGVKAPRLDVYDANSLDQTTPIVQQINLPNSIFTNYSDASRLSEIEWSTDNDHLLVKQLYPGGAEFLVVSRTKPVESFNVNRLFGVNSAQVSLYDKKADRLYMLDRIGGSLKLGNTVSRTASTVISKNVLTYKPYGKNIITYVTDQNEPAGKVEARIWDSASTYKLNTFDAGKQYLADAARFQGNFYFAVGSDANDRVSIYKNPIDQIKNPTYGRAIPVLALHIEKPQRVSFSENARFITVQSGQRLATYDIETDDNYEFSVKEPLAGYLVWMDGHRLIGQSESKVLVMDYDGTNRQFLTATSLTLGGLFNRDYKHLLTVAPAADGASFKLQDIDMRAGVDLPRKQ